MRFKTLCETHEFEIYQKEFRQSYERSSEKLGADLPLAYLRKSHVVGVFNAKNKMVAGYVIGYDEPFRLLDFVPQSARVRLIVPFGAKWSDCAEITCAWKLPTVSSVFMAFRLWPKVHASVLASGRKILVGHNQDERLDQFYTWAGPATIYLGTSTYGLHSRLFAYSRARMLFCIVMLYLYETPRRFFKRHAR